MDLGEHIGQITDCGGADESVVRPMRAPAPDPYGRPMTLDDATAQDLSERLADVFRTTKVSDVLADDVFLDGHPPFWRFQVQGRDNFAAWYVSFAPEGVDTTVVRTVPTATGFVTEFTGRHTSDGEEITDRKILLCEVSDGRISELTVYCSGDWNAELRARHAAETTLIR
ncbi:MAG: hypothetical protein QOI61_1842 [Actinomycetota bacterium]|jgi:ketosteroid isomerase-like protein